MDTSGVNAAEPSAVPPVPLRRNRNFRLLWVGQVLSDLGSQIGALAYTLLVYDLTGSAVISGTVGTIVAASAFAVRLPAGSLADRIDNRRAMIACDLVRTFVLLALGVGVVTHVVTWPVVLAIAIIDRLGDTFFSPSSIAALPKIVANEQLEDAWAATEARQYAANLLGPTLGGLLFSVARSIPFFGDALSYGISAALANRMRGDFAVAPTGGPRRGLWSEAFEGVRVMLHDKILRAIIIQAPLINFAFTGVIYTVILAMRHGGTSSGVIGLTQSAILVGGLLGAIAAPRLQGRFSLSTLVVGLTGGGAAFVAVAAILLPSPLVALPLAFPFFLSPTANAALFALLLRRAPESMRGRVNNALIQAATALATLSPVVSGLLVEHVSPHWAMGAFAVSLAVSAVIALSVKSLRSAEASAAIDA
jgi:MFS family permease